jgi:hypothetical protein
MAPAGLQASFPYGSFLMKRNLISIIHHYQVTVVRQPCPPQKGGL